MKIVQQILRFLRENNIRYKLTPMYGTSEENTIAIVLYGVGKINHEDNRMESDT